MTSSAARTETPILPFPPVKDRPIRLGVLISGGGTTLLNFLDQIRSGQLNAEVSLVIASHQRIPDHELHHLSVAPRCIGVHRGDNWVQRRPLNSCD